MLINTLGSLIITLGGTGEEKETLLILFSIANALGRLAHGLAADVAEQRYQILRAFWLISPLLFAVVGHMGIALSSSIPPLYAFVPLCGIRSV